MIVSIDTDSPCDLCKKKPATLHTLTIAFNHKLEKHLCNQCQVKEEETARQWDNFKPGDMK